MIAGQMDAYEGPINFLDLPDDTICEILCRCSWSDVLNVGITCRALNVLANQDYIWKILWERDGENSANFTNSSSPDLSWKDFYRQETGIYSHAQCTMLIFAAIVWDPENDAIRQAGGDFSMPDLYRVLDDGRTLKKETNATFIQVHVAKPLIAHGKHEWHVLVEGMHPYGDAWLEDMDIGFVPANFQYSLCWLRARIPTNRAVCLTQVAFRAGDIVSIYVDADARTAKFEVNGRFVREADNIEVPLRPAVAIRSTQGRVRLLGRKRRDKMLGTRSLPQNYCPT